MQQMQTKTFESKLENKKKQHTIELLERKKKSKQIHLERMQEILSMESNDVLKIELE